MKVDIGLLTGGGGEQGIGTEKGKLPEKEKPFPKIKETRPDKGREGMDGDDGKPRMPGGVKMALVITAMAGGFIVLVWNMIGFVNNVRLDNQGAPTVVYEPGEILDSFLDSIGDGSQVLPDKDTEEPSAGTQEHVETDTVYADESEEMAALRQEAIEARNEAALLRQELKNAEDMLESSLQREAELRDRLAGNTGQY